jgi:hypothetical protein
VNIFQKFNGDIGEMISSFSLFLPTSKVYWKVDGESG